MTCIMTPPSGCAVNNYGSEYVLSWGLICFSLGLLFTATNSQFLTLLLGRLACGAGSAFITTAAMVLIMSRFEDPKRTEYLGSAIGVGDVGGILGPPIAGHLFAKGQGIGFTQPQ